MSKCREARCIQECTSQLEKVLSLLERDLVHFLRAEGFITQEMCDDTLNERSMLSPLQKAGELVRCIRISVEADPQKFHTLLYHLKTSGPLYSGIVRMLEEAKSQPGSLSGSLIAQSTQLEEYAQLLRMCYIDHQVFPPDQWPPKLSEVYINLALVQHERFPVQESLSDFTKTTLNGTVDDLCFTKYKIELDEILKPDSFFAAKQDSLKQQREGYSNKLARLLNLSVPDFVKKRIGIPLDDGKDLPSLDEVRGVLKQPKFLSIPGMHKLLSSQESANMVSEAADSSHAEPEQSNLKILIDGAPGVGKTTLTWKLSQEWAIGKLFQQYKLIIRVSLRDLPEDPKSLWQILPQGSDSLKMSVEKELLDNAGKGTLLLLDGWDELSVEQRKKGSVLYKLVRGDLLPRCAVIITSRPYTSRWLQLPSHRHIELFGFTQDQIRSCIQSEFPSSPQSAKQLIQLLETRVDIFKLCYIPNNLSIVVHIFRTSQNSLPTTLSQLYQLYVQLATVRHLQNECDDPEEPLSYESASDFPQGTKELYECLCSLALHGLEKSRMVFKDSELREICPLLAKEAKTLGLLTAYKSFTTLGVQRSFQFIHATIQEFLAAETIARKTPAQQMEFVLNHIDDPRFRMVLVFLAGKTSLEQYESMFRLPLSFSGHPNVDRLLLLVRMLYEAQNPELCCELASHFPDDSFQLSKLVGLHMQTLTELDLYMLSYFLRHSSNSWKVIDALDAPSLSQILAALMSTPGGKNTVKELHIGTDTSDDMYKSLDSYSPVFYCLQAIRMEVQLPLGEHACKFLASHNLAHLHFDCYTQDSLEASVLAASQCSTLQSLSLKAMTEDKNRNLLKKLILSEGLPLPMKRSKEFAFKGENLVLTDGFVLTLCKELAASQCFEKLYLTDCTLNTHQLTYLFTTILSNCTLQVLSIRQVPTMQWSSDASLALCEVMSKNHTITSLHISPCSLDMEMAVSIGKALESNKSLLTLDLSHNRSLSGGIENVLNGIELSASLSLEHSLSPNLHTLVLAEVGLKDDNVTPLARFLSSSCCVLKELDVSYNSIKQEGCDSLCGAVASNATLEVLNLNKNPLWLSNGDQIELMLTQNHTLIELHLLSGLHIAAIEGLASGIAKNTTLQFLSVGEFFRTTPVEGACSLFAALRTNSSLKNMLLSAYALDDNGTIALAEALKLNSTIVSLKFQRCKFGSRKSVGALISSLYSHPSLHELGLPDTENAFKLIFSVFDKLNHHRAENDLPYLQVVDTGVSRQSNAKTLMK